MPFVISTGEIVNPLPLHTSAVILEMAGAGLTVTTIFDVTPGQVFADGVTTYVTVPVVAPGFVSV